jgi:hypothetical protein
MAEYICGMAIVVFAIYYPYLGKLFSPAIDPHRFRDFGILINLADWVVEHGRYPIGVYYNPPPNVIYMRLLTKIGAENAFRLHLVAQSTAFVFTLVAWSRIIGIDGRADRMRILLCACLAALFYVSFELQMHNMNMLCLGLVSVALWLRNCPWLSGALFAAAVAIKPYGSVLIVPYMLWSREFRWCLATAVWTIVVMAVLPIAYFGAETALGLYSEWLQSIAITANPEWVRVYGFSLQAGLAIVLGADFSEGHVKLLTHTTEAVWLVLLAWFFFPVLRRRVLPGGKILAAEVGALLIAPLPLGGLQQIARSVVFLVAALSIVNAVFERQTPRSWRVVLILILLAVAIVPRVVPLGQVQCVVTAALCILTLLGLAMTRALADRPTAPI